MLKDKYIAIIDVLHCGIEFGEPCDSKEEAQVELNGMIEDMINSYDWEHLGIVESDPGLDEDSYEEVREYIDESSVVLTIKEAIEQGYLDEDQLDEENQELIFY